jgi:protein-disulfide isomerase
VLALYEMKLFGTIMVLSAAFWMNGCAESEKRAVPKPAVTTAAKTKSEPVEDPQEQIRILRAELAVMRKELGALRGVVAKVLSAVDGGKLDSQKRAKSPPDTTIYDIALGSSPVLGRPDAPVIIVEFVDFQCPYCIREYPKLKAIMKEYPDNVKVVFKHFPLGSHKKAKPVHAAAELARIQGGSALFWKMHDKIMAKPREVDVSDLRKYAKSLDLDLTKFDELMGDKNRINALLSTDLSEARKCKVRGTPTVFINGLKLINRSINGYKARIDKILAGRAKG